MTNQEAEDLRQMEPGVTFNWPYGMDRLRAYRKRGWLTEQHEFFCLTPAGEKARKMALEDERRGIVRKLQADELERALSENDR